MKFFDGIKSLAGINSSLKELEGHLDNIVKKLKQVQETSQKAGEGVKKITAKGGQKHLGESGNTQMPNSLAPVTPPPVDMPKQSGMQGTSESRARFYMRNGGMQMMGGVAQSILGVGAGMMAAIPGMDVVGANALGYYQAGLGSGVNPMRIQQQTFSDLGGGFSSTGSGATAAAILRNRYIMPGTADFRQSMRQVGGAFRYLGMANETAAAAIGGMSTGPMGANLYQYGINVVDPRSGKARKPSDIAKDLFARMFPTGANREEVATALRYGYAGANMRNMGFTEDQRAIYEQMFMDIGAGKNPDLALKDYDKNPLKGVGIMAEAESELIMKKQDAMLRGFEKGAEIVKTLNKGLALMPDALFEFKAGLDAVSGSQVGQGGLMALSGLFAGLSTVMSGFITLMAARMGMAAMGVVGKGGGAGAGFFAGKGGAALKGLLKGGAFAVGGMAANFGADQLKSSFYDQDSTLDKAGLIAARAGANAAIGAGLLSWLGPVGMAAGATLGTGYGLYQGFQEVNQKGGKGGPGETTQSSSPVLPVGDVRVSSPYGPRQVKELGHTKPKLHRGTDYAVPVGTPVKAVKDGTVIRIEQNTRGYEAWHVLIDHGNSWSTLYAHLSQVSVRVGQQVVQGEVIGYSGTAGTGPHLHFEVRKNGSATNPQQFMSGATESTSMTSSDSGTGSSASSSVFMVNKDISGIKGNSVKLSEMYGKQSATSSLSSQSSVLYSDYMDEQSGSKVASSFGNNPLQKPELLKILYDSGFKKLEDLGEAYAIAMAESNGRPGAYNGNRSTGDDSYGIFQINMIDQLGQARLQKFKRFGVKTKEDLFNPSINAQVAAYMSQRGGNWSAWSSYGGDRYRSFLPSEEALMDELQSLGLSPVGGGTGTDGTMPNLQGSSTARLSTLQRMSKGSSSTVLNHAGNTVTINLQIMKASEDEAHDFAMKVKSILENDTDIRALGGQ